MKKITLAVACALLCLPHYSFAQTFTIPDRIEKLAAKAKESANITLDGPLLQLASAFLNSNDKDQAAAKAIVSKLKAIHVRHFEFESEGAYSDGDLDAIRAQLKSPGWSSIVESREKGEHSQIFVKQGKDVLAGLVILSAGRKELSIVIIDGAIDLNQLSKLGGSFGIPKDLPNPSAPPPKESTTGKDSPE